MATQIGVNTESFRSIYSDQIEELTGQLGRYIRNLQREKDDALPVEAETSERVTLLPNGLPLLPDCDLCDKTKDDLIPLIRAYLGRHYSE
jgi:hypothetical protein